MDSYTVRAMNTLPWVKVGLAGALAFGAAAIALGNAYLALPALLCLLLVSFD